MIESIVMTLFEGVLRAGLAVVVLPVICFLATPFILFAAAFSSTPYFLAVGIMYRRVADFWLEWDAVLFP